MKALNLITMLLLIIGGIDLGLLGLFGWDLLTLVFGFSPILLRIVYIIIGPSALWQIMPLTKTMQAGIA